MAETIDAEVCVVGAGPVGGVLACRGNCTFDESGCTAVNPCGNGVRETALGEHAPDERNAHHLPHRGRVVGPKPDPQGVARGCGSALRPTGLAASSQKASG